MLKPTTKKRKKRFNLILELVHTQTTHNVDQNIFEKSG